MAYEMVMPIIFMPSYFFRTFTEYPFTNNSIRFLWISSEHYYLNKKKSTYIFLKPTIFMDKHILKYHHTDHLSPTYKSIYFCLIC